MTHLYIELNTIPENVTSNVIHKLYETAKAIIDAEEANEVQESLVSLKGNLLVSKAYGDEIDWLEAKFPDLHITAGTRYIRFADPEVLRVLLANNIGDGTGVTEADASAVTYIDRLFYGNTTVTSFNELRYFTGGVLLLNGAFLNTSNLQSIDLSTVSFLSERCFRSSGITGVINLPNITSMQSLVFDNCKNITEINFGPLLTSMADGTCEGCSNLQKVTGLSNKTTIPEGMFNDCLKLSNIDIDFSKVTSIGGAAFKNCKLLTNLDLSDVVSIGSDAFRGCTSLTNVDLSSCTSIGDNAFNGCTSLAGVINLPVCTYWGKDLFAGCTSITEIHAPELVSSNQWTTIWGLTNLTTLDIPKSTRCFYIANCPNLTTINASAATTFGQRGEPMFYKCPNLTTLNVQFSKFPLISDNCFANSTGLNGQTFDFGDAALSRIGTEAFLNTFINCIFRYNGVIPAASRAFSNYSGLVYVPDDLVNDYKAAAEWSGIASLIHGISELPST